MGKRIYGYCEYGRFVIEPGEEERLTIEPYPFFNPWRKLMARLWMLRWWLHGGHKHWMPEV